MLAHSLTTKTQNKMKQMKKMKKMKTRERWNHNQQQQLLYFVIRDRHACRKQTKPWTAIKRIAAIQKMILIVIIKGREGLDSAVKRGPNDVIFT